MPAARRCPPQPTHRLGSLAAALAVLLGCAREEEPVPPEPPAPRRVVQEPSWFAHFDRAEQQFLFVDALKHWFAARGERAELDGHGRLVVDGAAGTQTFVVAGLAELAAQRPADEWEALIHAHFEAIVALRDAVGFVELPDWDDARTRLRLRIYPDSFLTEAGLAARHVVHRVDLPGTRTVLVVDAELTAMIVPQRALATWQQAAEPLLALGLENTRAALTDRLEVVSREFPGVGTLHVLTGESFYAATAVLWLDQWPELHGEHGMIVAVPWRHGVFSYPFDDVRVQRVVPALHRYAERIVEDSAGPIGAQIWWRRPDGSFAALGIEEQPDGRLAIEPPADLAALLRSMR